MDIQTALPPATSIHLHRLLSFSPQTMDRVVDSACLEHVQLGGGVFKGEVVRIESDGDVLDSGIYSHPILGRGDMPKERVTLGFMLPAQTGGLLNGCRLDEPVPFLYSEGAESGFRLEPGTRWIGLQVTRQSLAACGLELPDSHSGALHCVPMARERLINQIVPALIDFRTLAGVKSDRLEHAQFVRERFEGLIAAFVGALSPEPVTAPISCSAGHQRLVCDACEHLQANLAETVRIRDLCVLSGVSFKTLERAFVAVLGLTPRRYLSLTRLSHARRLLLDGNHEITRIADIATACGYGHLGRFSTDYRRLFGETPSRTFSQSP